MRRLAPALLSLVCFGCPQTIVVHPDAGFVADGGGADADAGAVGDSGVGDSGVGEDDAGVLDSGGPADGGASPCAGLPYCLGLEADPPRANVGEAVTVRPTLDNPSGVSLRMELCDVPRAVRAPGRPPLVFDEIELRARIISPDTGGIDFMVSEVPPWFTATTFAMEVCVYESGSSTPSLRVPTEVHVRGNVLVASGYQGIFAVRSDGRPATGKNNAYPEGKLIDDTLGRAGALRMASDGTLLVLDADARPARIFRYSLDGPDSRLATFAHLPEQLDGADGISYDNVAITTIAELPDGAFALADSHNSGTPNPRALIWNPDGTFRGAVAGGTPQDNWHSIASRRAGELLLGMSANILGQVIRIDPATGAELSGPRLTEDLRKDPLALEPLPDGRVVVGMRAAVMIVSDGGGAQTVTDLPGSSIREWRGLTRFDDRILAANDAQDDVENVAIIEGRRFVGWLRLPGVGGPIITPTGITYLE